MKPLLSVLLSLLALSAVPDACPGVVGNAAELARVAYSNATAGVRFDFEATVTFPTHPCNCMFGVEDATGAVALKMSAPPAGPTLHAGDRVRLVGQTLQVRDDPVFPEPEELAIVGAVPPPEPVRCKVADFLSGRHDCRLVRVEGTIWDCFVDEIDPQWVYLALGDGHEVMYMTFAAKNRDETALRSLIGTPVSATGLCCPVDNGARRFLGRLMHIAGPESLVATPAARDDPFDVPRLDVRANAQPAEIVALGRRRVVGRVLAVWQGANALVRADGGEIVRLEFALSEPPSCGEGIEAVGLPETDLYRVNLTRCLWRPARLPPVMRDDAAEEVSAARLLADENGRRRIDTRFHGRAIRLRGIVRSLSADVGGDDRLYLECDGSHLIPVDASACPEALVGVRTGCELAVSGVCVMMTDTWRRNSFFPRAKGFELIVRSPADVAVLAQPPWWTTGRLLSVIGAMLAVLIGIFIWNRMLTRIAERRGRELLNEELGHVKAELKVDERTRLAVELHDSLAQSLTGASMEIETCEQIGRAAPPEMLHHLDIASKTLKSCRDELRNCLWDLRSHALEEADLGKAIERTLSPHVNKARLVIRFNVPRARLSDNMTHAMLRMIRELVLNAIRHGGAASVRIAGRIDRDTLLFSVTDDGRGFDPDDHPGVPQGHFGLQGIRERVDRLGGRMAIDSAPGRGTRAKVEVPIPQQDEEGPNG